MKGIYLSQDLSHAKGIEAKIYKQIEEFELHDIEMVRHINPKRTMWHLFRNIVPFFSVQYFHTKEINWSSFSFAYIRKGAIFDKSFIQLIKKAKTENPQIRIIVEIPTYPYINEFKGLLKWDIELKEKRWTKYLKKYVDRIVTYSDDATIFDVPCINISNAYDFHENESFKSESREGIHFLAVAALAFYHGYDRVIEGLRIYYQQQKIPTKVKFTIVGDGPVLGKYQKLIEKYQLTNYIQLVGRKNFHELQPFYDVADIGIDSLGRHRSGVHYNSSLKGKEYLAKGLPSISGVKTDLDELAFPYYLRVPADDSPIDINQVVTWYQALLETKDKQEMQAEIIAFGKDHFTFSKTFEPVINYCLIGGK
jgi:glycosyltransferase involved in cell wall biosynthesis